MLTTVAPPPGVETFLVDTGHLAAGETAVYPQTPPVGGRHDPVWQRCGFYDGPVPTERAVHSLEHGVTWITFRPDLAESEKELLAELAHANPDVLVSRWDRACRRRSSPLPGAAS